LLIFVGNEIVCPTRGPHERKLTTVGTPSPTRSVSETSKSTTE
jgi:hypothetical protein